MTKLVYERIEGITFFPLPEQARPLEGFAGVTGGGWMAGVSPLKGLYRLDDVGGPVELPSPLPWEVAGSSGGWVGSGAWGRSLAGGGQEQGVLLDGLPALVVQQRLHGEKMPVTHLLTSPNLAPAVMRSVVQGLLPRISGRLSRGNPGEGSEPVFSLTGWPATSHIAEARDVLVQLPLNPPQREEAAADSETSGAYPGFLGVDAEGTLHRLTDEAAPEVALGALMAGEVALAEHLLPGVLSPITRPGEVRHMAGRLLFAAAWATWTGRVERLRPFGPALFEWVEGLETAGEPPLPSSLPSHERLFELLADALEPLGDAEAVSFLRQRAEARKPLPSRASRGGRPLPVLSGGGALGTGAEAIPPRPPEAHLPPLDAFASPHHPSARHRAGVHAARLLRSVVEGVLGVVPDAAWGRLRMAPDLTQVSPGEDGVRSLALQGLRVGDARIHLTCRVDGNACTLAMSQVGGRVPLNLVFEPLLPLKLIHRVEMGGEEVQVQIQEEARGTRVRLQFPLDPERSIRIHGESWREGVQEDEVERG